MKESLKSKATKLIESYKGQIVPIELLYKLCDDNYYKRSNLERRLRQSESPNVERVFKNGAIIGYKWKYSNACCMDMSTFGSHFGRVCKNTIPNGQLAF